MRLVVGLLTLLSVVGVAEGQQAMQPNCQYKYRFTNRTGESAETGVIITVGAAAAPWIDNTAQGCVGWQLQYSSEGFSAISLNLQSALRTFAGVLGASTPGTISTFTGTDVLSSLPLTSTSGGQYIGYAFFPYIRVNLATATGTGTVEVVLNGWKSITYAKGIGGGGSGTITSVGLVGTTNQITVTGTSPITSSGSWTLSFPANVTLPGNTTGTFIGNLTGTASTATNALSLGGNLAATYAPLASPSFTGTATIGTSLSFDAAAGVETGADISTPANPAASHTKLYAKGGVWCSLSPAGVENCLGAGGSPGGSGTELQYRSGASTFGGMAGTSWNSGTGTFAVVNGDGNTVLTFSSDPLSLDPFSFNGAQLIGPPSVAMGDGTPGSTVHFNAYLGGATTDPTALGGNAGGVGFISGAGGNGGVEGGYGGGIEFFAREGGNASANNGEGGGGGYVNISGGTGGNAASAGGVGGDGGDITLTVGVAGVGAMTNGRDGRIVWANGSNGASVSWNIPSTITSYVLTPPLAQGTGAMTNDGSGNLSWSGITQTCATPVTAVTVVGGVITAITCP